MPGDGNRNLSLGKVKRVTEEGEGEPQDGDFPRGETILWGGPVWTLEDFQVREAAGHTGDPEEPGGGAPR